MKLRKISISLLAAVMMLSSTLSVKADSNIYITDSESVNQYAKQITGTGTNIELTSEEINGAGFGSTLPGNLVDVKSKFEEDHPNRDFVVKDGNNAYYYKYNYVTPKDQQELTLKIIEDGYKYDNSQLPSNTMFITALKAPYSNIYLDKNFTNKTFTDSSGTVWGSGYLQAKQDHVERDIFCYRWENLIDSYNWDGYWHTYGDNQRIVDSLGDYINSKTGLQWNYEGAFDADKYDSTGQFTNEYIGTEPKIFKDWATIEQCYADMQEAVNNKNTGFPTWEQSSNMGTKNKTTYDELTSFLNNIGSLNGLQLKNRYYEPETGVIFADQTTISGQANYPFAAEQTAKGLRPTAAEAAEYSQPHSLLGSRYRDFEKYTNKVVLPGYRVWDFYRTDVDYNYTKYAINNSTPVQPQPQYGSVTVKYVDWLTNQDVAPADSFTNVSVGSHTYNAKSVNNYILQGQGSQTVDVQANQSYTLYFKYKEYEAPQPLTCQIVAPSQEHPGNWFTVTATGTDPTGSDIKYHWSVSKGSSVEIKNFEDGRTKHSGEADSFQVKFTDLSSTAYYTCYITSDGERSLDDKKETIPVNEPPQVYLRLPDQVTAGQTVNLESLVIEPDGDTYTDNYNTPADMTGKENLTSTGGAITFTTLGDKTITETATDPFGASGSATAKTTVVAPKPALNITATGTLKEKRKVVLRFDSNVDNPNSFTYTITNKSDGSKADIRTHDNFTLNKDINTLFWNSGTYEINASIVDQYGQTITANKEIAIDPDLAPQIKINLTGNHVRNQNDLSPHGLTQWTTTIEANAASPDGDNIVKTVYLMGGDSDGDGSNIYITKNEDGTAKATPEYERWYVYDPNYNGDTDMQQIVEIPDNTSIPSNSPIIFVKDGHKYAYINDSLNLHWRYIGNFFDAQNFDIDSINCGVLPSVPVKGTSVGWNDFEVKTKEEFGQPTISDLVTSSDRKSASSFNENSKTSPSDDEESND